MSKYTFDATFPDGSPRRYAGTWRPPIIEVDFHAYLDTHRIFAYQPDTLDKAHQAGAFDKPLYHVEETLRSEAAAGEFTVGGLPAETVLSLIHEARKEGRLR